MTPYFHDGLRTYVDAIAYDFHERRAVIWVPEDCCTDMAGAIRLAQKIDRRVREVHVNEGHTLDVVYRRTGRTWVAFDYAQARRAAEAARRAETP